jgi:hypothetical protein
VNTAPYGPPAAFATSADADPAALGRFQPVLAPYGRWVETPSYGMVWVPDATVVGAGFSPYVTAGHWTYTAQGYSWASDYAWGWAPFHYGRWVLVDGYGWSWIPGAQWAPAWVSWQWSNGYLGWAPMAPSYGFRSGVAFSIGIGAVPSYTYVPHDRFLAPSVGPYVVHGSPWGTRPYVQSAPPVYRPPQIAPPAVYRPQVAPPAYRPPQVAPPAFRPQVAPPAYRPQVASPARRR